jgi:thiol peroxidase
MKKLLGLLIISLLSINLAQALQLTSDDNGPVQVSEPQLQVGDMAPPVTLTTSDYKTKQIGGATGKVQIISTIESFNTSVCDTQTMALNDAAKQLKNVQISVVTANMPFIVDDFKNKHHINNINLLSTFNSDVFGKKYGVQVVGGELTGITARSVFVVDKNGKIIYKEITSDIDKMPNLKAAIAVAQKAALA